MKTCIKCQENLEESFFYGNRKKCQRCQIKSYRKCEMCNKSNNQTKFRRGQSLCIKCEKDEEATKKCSSCKEELKVDMFYVNKTRCKRCQDKRYKKCVNCEKSNNQTEFRRGQSLCVECENEGIECEKKCIECGKTKTSSEFRKNRKKCIDCERANGRNYRRTTTKAKEWSEKNKERMKELRDRWYQENKEKIREKYNKKWKEDENFRVVKTYRCKLSMLLKGKTKTNKQLMSTRKQFKKWLKFCFTDDMDIDNYGKEWHIDHVIPLKKVEKIKKSKHYMLFAWYNTMPISPSHNLTKNKKYDFGQMITHLKNLGKYVKKIKDDSDINLDGYYKYRKLVQLLIDCKK